MQQKIFDATLQLQRRPINSRNLAYALLRPAIGSTRAGAAPAA